VVDLQIYQYAYHGNSRTEKKGADSLFEEIIAENSNLIKIYTPKKLNELQTGQTQRDLQQDTL
jgi:hypothetical protein